MAVSRVFGSLHIYNILANLLPGTMLIFVLSAVVPVEDHLAKLSPGILIAALLIIGFVAGHLVQMVASHLNGRPRLFSQVVSNIRGTEPYSPGGTLEQLPQSLRGFMGFERADISDMHLTEVEEDIWELSKDQFDLTDDFSNDGRLMQLILSYLESVPASRALRFQSIHTFHRSMWGGWFLSLFLVLLVGIAGFLDILTTRSPLILGTIAIVSVLGIWVFGQRKEKFNRMFVEYTIIDFYVQQKGEAV